MKIFNFLEYPALILFLIILPISFEGIAASAVDEHMEVHFIDVGDGDAVLIIFPDSSTMMIDAGEEEHSSKLFAHLNALKIQRIDTAIITHPHKNHFEGFRALLKDYRIGRFFINGFHEGDEGYDELLDSIRERNIPINILKRGDIIDQLPQDVHMEVLNPENLEGGINDSSLVTWLIFKDASFLFTADIGTAQQDEILDNFEFIKEAKCVQIPHHGGQISDRFANSFKEAIFVVSTGDNEWSKPWKDYLNRLEGKRVLRTDQEGNIRLRLTEKILK